MPERIFQHEGGLPFAAYRGVRNLNQLFSLRYQLPVRNMQMIKLNTRDNEQRFFHISRQGWYLRTREGLKGPFGNRGKAQILLDGIIEKNTISSYN